MEHQNQRLKRRHVQEHLDARRDSLLQKFTGQRPAKRKCKTCAETAVATFAKEFRKQNYRRNHIANERTISSARNTHRRNRSVAVNQHKVARHVHNHASESRLHHDLGFANSAKETRRGITQQVDYATEHQDIEIRLLVFELVGRQMLQSKRKMPQRNREVQKWHRNQRQIHRLHKHTGAIPAFFTAQALSHHCRRIANRARKKHRECKLHRPRPKRRIHFGRAKLREEQTVDERHERIKRHRQKHRECHHEHILHVPVLLEFRRFIEPI